MDTWPRLLILKVRERQASSLNTLWMFRPLNTSSVVRDAMPGSRERSFASEPFTKKLRWGTYEGFPKNEDKALPQYESDVSSIISHFSHDKTTTPCIR